MSNPLPCSSADGGPGRRALWLLLVLLLAACGETPDHTIRMGLASAPITLDPRQATDAVSWRLCRLLYRALVDFDEHYQPVPELARWRQLGPRHYRFTLVPQGRRFSDGTRLMAKDVQATYASLLDPASTSPHRGSLEVIARVEAIDPERVDFFLKRPDPLFPGRLVIGILPAVALAAGHDFAHSPLGSGPFRLLAWPDNGRLLLQRRADGQRIGFLKVGDASVRALKLARGEIDLLQGDMPRELLGWLRQRPGLRLETRPGTTFSYLGFNLEDPVVGRHEVREAIALAIDRQTIIHYVLGDAARPAGALLPPTHWAGLRGRDGIPHDPERARRILAGLGYGPGHPLRISYKTSSNPFRLRLATIIASQLHEVGIEVDIRSYDWGTFYGDIKAGRFQMYSLAWVGLKMPDIFRYVFHSASVPPHGANRGRFRDPVTDHLIEQAEATPDLAGQAFLYRRLQAHLLEALPYIPLWYEDQVLAIRKDLAGYTLSADGNYDGLIRIHENKR